MKAQPIRLVDVFLLGPFMVWFGVKAKGVSPAARKVMVAAGVLTILYNGMNYLTIKEDR